MIVTPETGLGAEPHRQALAGNTCLYGATGGRLHVVGRAGMTGGRAFLHDPDGGQLAALETRSVAGRRLAAAAAARSDGEHLVAELIELLEAHRDAGSELARRLLLDRTSLVSDVLLVEPVGSGKPVGSGEPDGPLPRPTVGVAAGAADGLAAGDVPIATRSLTTG